MKRLTKRRLVLGLAGLLMVVGFGAASPVSANPSCLGADTAFCNSETITYQPTGFIPPAWLGMIGDAQTNIAPTLAQQKNYDAIANTDRVNGH